MVCCAILATVIGSIIWLFRAANPKAVSSANSSLEWRLEAAALAPQSQKPRFRFQARAKSFTYAFNGLKTMVREEHNAWIHLAGTFVVVSIAIILKINLADWRWILTAVALVWFAEAINTAIERLCDVVSPNYHEGIKASKDIAAGAVLVCSLLAVAIGATTFLPYLARVTGEQGLGFDICRTLR